MLDGTLNEETKTFLPKQEYHLHAGERKLFSRARVAIETLYREIKETDLSRVKLETKAIMALYALCSTMTPGDHENWLNYMKVTVHGNSRNPYRDILKALYKGLPRSAGQITKDAAAIALAVADNINPAKLRSYLTKNGGVDGLYAIWREQHKGELTEKQAELAGKRKFRNITKAVNRALREIPSINLNQEQRAEWTKLRERVLAVAA